jgi:hypothetical protein
MQCVVGQDEGGGGGGGAAQNGCAITHTKHACTIARLPWLNGACQCRRRWWWWLGGGGGGRYKIASSSREDGPMKDEIGPWYVDTEWPGYWYDLNSELTYWPIGASNRLELGRNLGKQFKLNVDNGNLARNVVRRAHWRLDPLFAFRPP